MILYNKVDFLFCNILKKIIKELKSWYRNWLITLNQT